MTSLTLKELTHKKGKFILIILGISFSIFLVQISAGMWNGVLSRASEVFDRYGFDVWIKEKDSTTMFDGGIINESVYNEVKEMNNIDDIERLIYTGGLAETEDYAMSCYVIGYELDSDNIEPWDIIKGDIKDLNKENAIIIDKGFNQYFNNLEVGDKLIINRVEMEIVGMCENAKFMGNPYAWTSLVTARKFSPWAGNWSNNIGIKLAEGYSINEFNEDIEKMEDNGHIDDVEVISTEELRQNTYDFIVNEGGMGGSIYIIVAMGYFVALIIISVSMYQTIQEKIPEFGTLKAIGASKGFLNRMLLGQMFIYVTLGFIIASILTFLCGVFMNDISIVPISLSIPVSVVLYGVTLLLCTICALITIRRVHKIDPVIVFSD